MQPFNSILASLRKFVFAHEALTIVTAGTALLLMIFVATLRFSTLKSGNAGVKGQDTQITQQQLAEEATANGGQSNDGGQPTNASTPNQPNPATPGSPGSGSGGSSGGGSGVDTSGDTNMVGYVGCSNTQDSVDGYYLVGGKNFWPQTNNYGGGTPGSWEGDIDRQKQYWPEFNLLHNSSEAAKKTKRIWFQFCLKESNEVNSSYDAAVIVIAEVKKFIPNAIIYASAINGFSTPGKPCNIIGPDGPAKAQQVADMLVNNGKAITGPDVGDLTFNQTKDSCHPNEEGMKLIGAKLLNFFG